MGASAAWRLSKTASPFFVDSILAEPGGACLPQQGVGRILAVGVAPASRSRPFLFLFLAEPHVPASSVPPPPNLCLLFSPSVLPIAFPVSAHHETQSIRDERCPVKVGGDGASLTGRHPPMPVPLVCVGGFSSELQSACKSQQGVVNTRSQCGCSPPSPTLSFSVPNTRTSASSCGHVLASSIHFVLSIVLRASCCMVCSVHSQLHRNRVEPLSSF